jgi:geranylgeranylglycerol-phosphate geranylgeranyltransferase
LQTAIGIISIVRPINCLITFFTIVVAAFISTETPNYNIVFIAALAGALVNAGGNIINDYFDIEIDKTNRPERPLPSESISQKLALKLYLYFTLFAFALVYNISNEALAIVALTSAMMFLYSYKLKGAPLVGNFVVAFFIGLAFLFGSVVVGNIYAGIIPMAFAFLISLMRELVKDIEDIDGDKTVGISTFPIKFGIDKTVRLIIIIGVILILSTTIPFLLKIYNLYYFIFVSLFVNGILVYVIRELKRNASRKAIQKISWLLKLGMIFGVVAILLGTKL